MYRVHKDGIESGVFRVADGAWIPNCALNRDWQEFLAWVAEGNEPEPWEE